MRVLGLSFILALCLSATTLSQEPPEPFQPVGTMKQLMLDMIYPASNDILFYIYRGAPQNDKDWAALQHSAMVLAESGNLLMMRGRSKDRNDWLRDSKILVDVGAAAYKAAREKDANALKALDTSLDAACLTCHKQYRPNVFPPSK